MACALCPCRQGRAAGGSDVDKPKDPHALCAFAAGHAIPGASAPCGYGSPARGGRDDGDEAQTMEALLRWRMPRDVHAQRGQ